MSSLARDVFLVTAAPVLVILVALICVAVLHQLDERRRSKPAPLMAQVGPSEGWRAVVYQLDGVLDPGGEALARVTRIAPGGPGRSGEPETVGTVRWALTTTRR